MFSGEKTGFCEGGSKRMSSCPLESVRYENSHCCSIPVSSNRHALSEDLTEPSP